MILKNQMEAMRHPTRADYPVVIIGSGPIGLAAAARLVARQEPFVVFERGPSFAASVRAWGHVRLFTPWRYNVDPEAVTLLEAAGWAMPDPDAFPTGDELAERYLAPLAGLPGISARLRLHQWITAIARQTRSKLEEDRVEDPFLIEYVGSDGHYGSILARAVVDAAGVWQTHNPIGANGLPVPGERSLAESIAYGVPDVLGHARSSYARHRVLVVGSGHSADGSTVVLLFAVLLGSSIGLASDRLASVLGGAVDWTVLSLIFLLALDIPFSWVRLRPADVRFLLTAWVTNFVIIPPIGFLFASLFLSGEPLLATGVFVYLLSPCTDWFLGFTRLARGNTALGSLLIPINMASQLALYPVYLMLFTRWRSDVEVVVTGETMLQWFVLPFGLALVVRLAFWVAGRRLPCLTSAPPQASTLIPVIVAAIVLQIFAANISVITDHLLALVRILAAVFSFFVLTWFTAERISRTMAIAYPDHVLFTFTTAARNAPLMLGGAVVAIPDQPLVYAALIIGMLVEFPHLTMLKHLLRQQRLAAADGAAARHTFGSRRASAHGIRSSWRNQGIGSPLG